MKNKLIVSAFLLLALTGLNLAQTNKNKVSDTDISGGLKEALGRGVSNAIKSLGKEDGFLSNVRVKIPLPKSLQKIEKVVRVAGQGKVVDEFVASTKTWAATGTAFSAA